MNKLCDGSCPAGPIILGSIFQHDSIVLGPASAGPNKNRSYCTWTYQHWVMPLVAPINVALHLLGTKNFEFGQTRPNTFDEFRCLNLVRP